MILSIWSVIKSWFWPVMRFVFRCVVCFLEQIVEAESAEAAVAKIQKAGWRGWKPGEEKGWRCPKCG